MIAGTILACDQGAPKVPLSLSRSIPGYRRKLSLDDSRYHRLRSQCHRPNSPGTKRGPPGRSVRFPSRLTRQACNKVSPSSPPKTILQYGRSQISRMSIERKIWPPVKRQRPRIHPSCFAHSHVRRPPGMLSRRRRHLNPAPDGSRPGCYWWIPTSQQ
jgi:hypothetical protein